MAAGINARRTRRTADHTTVFGPHSHTIRSTGGMLRSAFKRERQVSPYDFGIAESVTAGRHRILQTSWMITANQYSNPDDQRLATARLRPTFEAGLRSSAEIGTHNDETVSSMVDEG